MYLVIEEDGTEVDDEEYFSTLTDNTVFMLLFKEDIWSPQGPAYTWVRKRTLEGFLVRVMIFMQIGTKVPLRFALKKQEATQNVSFTKLSMHPI